jgi:hypothetical protein
MSCIDDKSYGIWWTIAGAGWVVRLPDDYGQLKMFDCRSGHPFWGVEWAGRKPLLFTEKDAKRMAEEFSLLGIGKYEARLYVPPVKKDSASDFVRNFNASAQH